MSHARHVNIARLPGFGDAAPPEPGPWCECADCEGTGKDEQGEECEFCQGLVSYYDESA